VFRKSLARMTPATGLGVKDGVATGVGEQTHELVGVAEGVGVGGVGVGVGAIVGVGVGGAGVGVAPPDTVKVVLGPLPSPNTVDELDIRSTYIV
jgi:hypothetical protein